MAKGTVNKVILLGRLGQDPEIKATQGGMQIATLSIATNELGKKDQATGQRGPDQVEWHRCTAFGRTAEIAGQYLQKGSMVYLEGRLQTRKWQDPQGNDRWSTDIVINEMQFVGGGQGQGQQQAPAQQQAPQQQRQAQNQAPAQQAQAHQQPQQQGQQQRQQTQGQQQAPQPQQGGGFDDFDDDIPF